MMDVRGVPFLGPVFTTEPVEDFDALWERVTAQSSATFKLYCATRGGDENVCASDLYALRDKMARQAKLMNTLTAIRWPDDGSRRLNP